MKRAREVRKFHVVQRRQRNVQNSVVHVQSERGAHAKLLFVNINISFFAVLLPIAVVIGFVVIQKKCYHGNATSLVLPLNFLCFWSSLLHPHSFVCVSRSVTKIVSYFMSNLKTF